MKFSRFNFFHSLYFKILRFPFLHFFQTTKLKSTHLFWNKTFKSFWLRGSKIYRKNDFFLKDFGGWKETNRNFPGGALWDESRQIEIPRGVFLSLVGNEFFFHASKCSKDFVFFVGINWRLKINYLIRFTVSCRFYFKMALKLYITPNSTRLVIVISSSLKFQFSSWESPDEYFSQLGFLEKRFDTVNTANKYLCAFWRIQTIIKIARFWQWNLIEIYMSFWTRP